MNALLILVLVLVLILILILPVCVLFVCHLRVCDVCVMCTEGRHPEAIRLALAAAPFVASLPPSHSYHHTLPLCLGCALYGAKQFPQALQQFKKAVEVAERGWVGVLCQAKRVRVFD